MSEPKKDVPLGILGTTYNRGKGKNFLTFWTGIPSVNNSRKAKRENEMKQGTRMVMNENGSKNRVAFDGVPTGVYEVYAWYYDKHSSRQILSENYENEECAKARLRQVNTHRILDLEYWSSNQEDGTPWGEDKAIETGVRQVVANRRVVV
jgi:hypothetical protein|tara:strand:+ start:529 stop:978 length:450 start_codon:yes stop_codon:yes gene_type:complete